MEGRTVIHIRRALPKIQMNKQFVCRTIERLVGNRYGGGR